MKKYSILLAILFCLILLVSCNTSEKSARSITDVKIASDNITMRQMDYEEKKLIYDSYYQSKLLSQVTDIKKSQKYDIDNVLTIFNPFGTNTTGLYIYFNTDKLTSVQYNIHVNDKEISDFNNTLYNGQKNNISKKHEYQLIGLMPNMDNTITLNLYDKNGELYCTKTFTVKAPKMSNIADLKLEKESGSSFEPLSNGLFMTLGHIEAEDHNSYLYDNDGNVRGEYPLDGYRIDSLIFKDNLMYISVNESTIAGVNRLGYPEVIYDLGNYSMHHDYILGKDDSLLILASKNDSDSIEDFIIKLDLKTKKVSEISNLGNLFGEYKKKTQLSEDKAKLDWIHINSLYIINENELLLSSRETSTIIKISDIYKNPQLEYLIGPKELWKDTPYSDYTFNKDGDFPIQGGQHCLIVEENDGLLPGQYYLHLYNNNTGVSTSYPDFDWSIIENVDTISMYYKYFVDENKRTFTLVKQIEVDPSRYISSVQLYDGHLIIDSGNSFTIYEFDSNDELIAKFKIDQEMWGLYRCLKYSFNDFYFYKP